MQPNARTDEMAVGVALGGHPPLVWHSGFASGEPHRDDIGLRRRQGGGQPTGGRSVAAFEPLDEPLVHLVRADKAIIDRLSPLLIDTPTDGKPKPHE